MSRPSRSIVSAAWVVVGLAMFAGCPPQDDPARTVEADPGFQDALRLRALNGFARGWLSKPADGQSGEDAFAMAPLLIHATTGAAPLASPARIGAVSRSADGQLSVDATAPTLYHARTAVQIAGREHVQLAYVWWTAVSTTDPGLAGSQGVRMTLDASGSPFLWEVLADTSGTRLFFADRALEEAASAEFGPPSPGREHALEQPLDETPDALVVRLIESGSTPLGPFVYLAEDGRDVTTVLCRCMASEVDEIVGVDEYALQPLSTLEALGVEPRWPTSPDELGTILRLPESPGAEAGE